MLALFLAQVTGLVLIVIYNEHLPEMITTAYEHMQVVRPEEFDRVKQMVSE